MLTWPCRVVLSRFQSSLIETIRKTRPFDPSKEPRTLSAYFKLAKQFLSYVDRVAVCREYYFSVDAEIEMRRPEDAIKLSDEQSKTWHSIRRIAQQMHSGCAEGEDDLEDELVRMWMLLICHSTGAKRYRSPLLSFCAMLSIKS